MRLPAMLQKIADNIDDPAEYVYATSIIEPFGSHANGVRIPTISMEETITSYDY